MSGHTQLNHRMAELMREVGQVASNLQRDSAKLQADQGELSRLDALRKVAGTGPEVDGVTRLPSWWPTWQVAEVCALASVDEEVVRRLRLRAGLRGRLAGEPLSVESNCKVISAALGGHRSDHRLRAVQVYLTGLGLALGHTGGVRCLDSDGRLLRVARGELGGGAVRRLGIVDDDGQGVPFVRCVEAELIGGASRLSAIAKVARDNEIDCHNYLLAVADGVAAAARLCRVGLSARPFALRLSALVVSSGVGWFRGCELLDRESNLLTDLAPGSGGAMVAVGDQCRMWLHRPRLSPSQLMGGGDDE